MENINNLAEIIKAKISANLWQLEKSLMSLINDIEF